MSTVDDEIRQMVARLRELAPTLPFEHMEAMLSAASRLEVVTGERKGRPDNTGEPCPVCNQRLPRIRIERLSPKERVFVGISSIEDKAGLKALRQLLQSFERGVDEPPASCGTCFQPTAHLATAYPVAEMLRHLLRAADILFDKGDYDGPGWELLQSARDHARAYLRRHFELESAPADPTAS